MRLLVFYLILCLGFIARVDAQNNRKTSINSILEKEYAGLELAYKHLHASPELSFQEEKTASFLANELQKLQFQVTQNIGGYGLVGMLKNGPGPVIMVRTDLDALPIKEVTGVSYSSTVQSKSENGGEVSVMHACGHDIHMTVWLGLAKVMTRLSGTWKGTIILVGQPAEERGAGARAMIEDGLFSKFPVPDYILSLHVNANLAAGTVGICSGYALANIDMVDITVKGVGGHGAMPQSTIDPIVMASKLVLDFQTIVSREISPTESSLITVGSIHGGTKGNIIPAEVKLELTVRSFKDEIQQQLLEKIKVSSQGIAIAAGVRAENYPVVSIRNEHIPSLYNEPELCKKIITLFTSILGANNVISLSPEMYGEDFSQYGRDIHHIPILQYSLGTVSESNMVKAKNKEIQLPSTHSALYLPEMETSIKTGVLTMSSAILLLLQGENNTSR